MKKFLKILSVFALASPAGFSASCAHSKNTEKAINLKAEFIPNDIKTLNDNYTFNIKITEDKIKEIRYKPSNGSYNDGYLVIDFVEKTAADPYNYMSFKSGGLYFRLTEIRIELNSQHIENRDEQFNYFSSSVYSDFEFDFNHEVLQLDLTNNSEMFPLNTRGQSNLSINATQI